MKRDPITDGKIAEHGTPVGTVTAEMVRQRARELALINGRACEEFTQADWEEAMRELAGRAPLSPNEPGANIPETERWDPVPGSPGHQVINRTPPDEQTVLENMVENGVAEADDEKMAEAARESLKEQSEE